MVRITWSFSSRYMLSPFLPRSGFSPACTPPGIPDRSTIVFRCFCLRRNLRRSLSRNHIYSRASRRDRDAPLRAGYRPRWRRESRIRGSYEGPHVVAHDHVGGADREAGPPQLFLDLVDGTAELRCHPSDQARPHGQSQRREIEQIDFYVLFRSECRFDRSRAFQRDLVAAEQLVPGVVVRAGGIEDCGPQFRAHAGTAALHPHLPAPPMSTPHSSPLAWGCPQVWHAEGACEARMSSS